MFIAKLRKIQRFLFTSCPDTFIASSIISIPQQSSAFVTVDESTLIHNQPKSTVYNGVHSPCCTSYGFGQMINDMYPHPYSIIESSFTVLKFFCVPPFRKVRYLATTITQQQKENLEYVILYSCLSFHSEFMIRSSRKQN